MSGSKSRPIKLNRHRPDSVGRPRSDSYYNKSPKKSDNLDDEILKINLNNEELKKYKVEVATDTCTRTCEKEEKTKRKVSESDNSTTSDVKRDKKPSDSSSTTSDSKPNLSKSEASSSHVVDNVFRDFITKKFEVIENDWKTKKTSRPGSPEANSKASSDSSKKHKKKHKKEKKKSKDKDKDKDKHKHKDKLGKDKDKSDKHKASETERQSRRSYRDKNKRGNSRSDSSLDSLNRHSKERDSKDSKDRDSKDSKDRDSKDTKDRDSKDSKDDKDTNKYEEKLKVELDKKSDRKKWEDEGKKETKKLEEMEKQRKMLLDLLEKEKRENLIRQKERLKQLQDDSAKLSDESEINLPDDIPIPAEKEKYTNGSVKKEEKETKNKLADIPLPGSDTKSDSKVTKEKSSKSSWMSLSDIKLPSDDSKVEKITSIEEGKFKTYSEMKAEKEKRESVKEVESDPMEGLLNKGPVAAPVAPAGPKKLTIGLKISETSAARISTGLLPHQLNLEDGELSADSQDTKSEKEPAAGTESDDLGIPESTDGEVSDDEDEEGEDEKKKKHKKKKKKKKQRKSSKDKSSKSMSPSSKRKHSHSRSRTPKRHKRSHSRSRSRSRSYDKKRGVWRERSKSRSPKRVGRDNDRRRGGEDWRFRRSRSPRGGYGRNRRSRSRERHADYREREQERTKWRGRNSRSRSRERAREKDRMAEDLRCKIDKAKLRQIAIQNAYKNMATGVGPVVTLKPDLLASLKAGGKSVEELTDFCKKIAQKPGNESSSDSDREMYVRHDSDEESFMHHPFKLKESTAPIVMNIRNAKQLPTATFADRTAQSANLRIQFPVSSGSQHRVKEREWVPVEATTAGKTGTVAKITMSIAGVGATTTTATMTAATGTTPAVPADSGAATGETTEVKPEVKPEDMVFPEMSHNPLNIGDLVTERLSAMRKLQDNPMDVEAMNAMYKAQKQMNQWATPLPGQFTGSTGAQILTQDQLIGVDKKHQAWLKKDQFSKAAPVKGGIGMFLLKKMGWQEGTGLGKTQEGSLEPLMLDVKTDRRGLSSTGENQKKAPTIQVQARAKDLSGKHPVSALMELCSRRKWGSPEFLLVHESGPDHKKHFLYKVKINNQEYQPSVASNTKKLARADAAAVVLQEMGLLPKTD